jgi:DNA-binding NtrC family response regulator
MPATRTRELPDTVLVVDDEDVIVQILTTVLQARGLQVRAAFTAEEALGLIETERFGCIITDKNLPGADGLAVIRHARRHQPFCACILVTGFSSAASAIEALRLGATDYLEKPFEDLDLVGEKIENAVRQKRVELERARLMEQIKSFEAELTTRDASLSAVQSELDMFNQLVELRVAQATEDLKKQKETLEACLRMENALDSVLETHAETLLTYVRTELARCGPDDAGARLRGVLSRVQRQVEAHLALLRNSGKAPT